MYIIMGYYQNCGKSGVINTNGEVLGEVDTMEEAERIAKAQEGAWDNIAINEGRAYIVDYNGDCLGDFQTIRAAKDFLATFPDHVIEDDEIEIICGA